MQKLNLILKELSMRYDTRNYDGKIFEISVLEITYDLIWNIDRNIHLKEHLNIALVENLFCSLIAK